jgi:amino acid transporter
VIGAGIYGLPGTLMEKAGSFSPWLIVIIGLLVLTVVLTFAVLASYFSGTGGPILYASSAFGPFVGFQTGWLLYTARVASFAANVNVLFDYVAYLWDGASAGFLRNVMIFIVIALLILINILGIKKAIQAINVLTFFKTVPLIVMIILGFQYLTPEVLLPQELPRIDDTSALILLVLYAFIGFESSLVSAGETQNPKTTMPGALISMMLLITVFYFLVQFSYVMVAPSLSESAPLVGMGEALLGTVGAVVIVLTAIFSVTGNVTSSIISSSRISFTMARDGCLPPWFGELHEKYNTPVNSLVFLAVLVFLLAISGTFLYLAIASTLIRMLAYAICLLALPIIRKNADEKMREEAIWLPGGWTIPVIAMIVSLFAISQATLISWLYLGGFFLLGNLLYFVNRRIYRRSPDEQQESA